MGRLAFTIFFIAALAALAALPARRADAEDAGGASAEWTILVYHDADCDLEAPMLGDLDEMIAAGDSKDVKVVAFVDRSPKAAPEGRYSNRAVGGLADWSGGKLVQITKGKLVELGSTAEEPNFGDPATLVAFVERAMKEFPAKRYALVFGDHGLAWPGVCADESHDDDFLTPGELAGALRAVTDAHGRLDLVGFDACLMANLEIAALLAPFSKVMVASEELEPGTGWWYTPVLEALGKAPTTDAATLATIIADRYRASFAAQKGVAGPGEGLDVTLSVVDLSKVGAVVAATTALGEAAAKAIDAKGREAYLPLAKARAAAEQYGRSADPRQPGSQMYDLVDLATRIALLDPALAPVAQQVVAAVRAAVVHAVRGDARPDSHGLSVYVPRDAAGLGALYDTTPLGGSGGWARFLKAFARVSADDKERPSPGETASSAESAEAERPATVTATVASTDDLERVAFVLAAKVGDGVVLVGSVPAEVSEDGKLSETWTGGWFTLEDGTQRVICPVTSFDEVDEAEETYVADVPAQVRAEGTEEWLDVTLTFFLDEADDGSVRGQFLRATAVDDGGPSEIPLEPGDEVRVAYVQIDASGSASTVVGDERSTLTVDDEDNLKVGYDRVSAGDWLLGFWLEDYAGNSAVSLVPVTVK